MANIVIADIAVGSPKDVADINSRFTTIKNELNGNIDATNIKDGAVGEAKIASGAVTEGKLGAGAVTASKLGASAVETAKINNLAVTAAKLAADSVETAKIVDDAVTIAKLHPFAAWQKMKIKTDDTTAITVTANTPFNVYETGTTPLSLSVDPTVSCDVIVEGMLHGRNDIASGSGYLYAIITYTETPDATGVESAATEIGRGVSYSTDNILDSVPVKAMLNDLSTTSTYKFYLQYMSGTSGTGAVLGDTVSAQTWLSYTILPSA